MSVVERVAFMRQFAASGKAPAQKTEAWLQQRRGLVTCSAFATIAGRNPYETVEAWVEAKSFAGLSFHAASQTQRGRDKFSRKFTDHGNRTEDVAIDRFEQTTGRVVYRGMPLFTPAMLPYHEHYEDQAYHFLGGSPDGITDDGAIIEVKCPVTRVIKMDGPIPPEYVDQVQGGMYLTGLRHAYFIEYRPPAGMFDEILHVVHVEYDAEWLPRNIEQFRRARDDVADNWARIQVIQDTAAAAIQRFRRSVVRRRAVDIPFSAPLAVADYHAKLRDLRSQLRRVNYWRVPGARRVYMAGNRTTTPKPPPAAKRLKKEAS